MIAFYVAIEHKYYYPSALAEVAGKSVGLADILHNSSYNYKNKLSQR